MKFTLASSPVHGGGDFERSEKSEGAALLHPLRQFASLTDASPVNGGGKMVSR
jgi:hypothetical protein